MAKERERERERERESCIRNNIHNGGSWARPVTGVALSPSALSLSLSLYPLSTLSIYSLSLSTYTHTQ